MFTIDKELEVHLPEYFNFIEIGSPVIFGPPIDSLHYNPTQIIGVVEDIVLGYDSRVSVAIKFLDITLITPQLKEVLTAGKFTARPVGFGMVSETTGELLNYQHICISVSPT